MSPFTTTLFRETRRPRCPSQAAPTDVRTDDILVHRTRNTPKCATTVLLDMSGSMRYDGLYVNVKRMGLALDGLIRREYPGDWLQFIEVATFAKPRQPGEIVTLLPKPVTIADLAPGLSYPDYPAMPKRSDAMPMPKKA